MRKSKYAVLYQFKNGDAGNCLALVVLKYQQQRFRKKYYFYQEILQRKKVGSKGFEKALAKVRKTYSKAQVLMEIIAEIERLQKKIALVDIENFDDEFKISKSSDYARSCKNKVKYSEGSAKQAALDVAEKLNEMMEHYKCRHCDGWHIGHALF